MTLLRDLRKSAVIAPIEDALRHCDTPGELEDIWFDMADGFSDESVERRHLLGVYQEQLAVIRQRMVASIGLVGNG